MPGRTKVTKMIDELYVDMMLKLKDMLKQSSSVSLTTDAAKMPTGDSYVAITGHWISSGWELLSAVLAVSISNVSHTAQEIGSLIMELGIKYTLDDRLDAIATDNGANFVAAMEDLLENGICKTWADLPKAVSCMRDFVLADIKRCWDTGNLLLGMAAVVDPRHISLEWLTPLQQQTIKQQLLQEMFAVAGVPSDNDALEKECAKSHKAKTI
ncbi:hypothetical protein EMCRGX_G000362 [Ephydatia muelleri]